MKNPSTTTMNKGSLLEWLIKRIFETVGYQAKQNIIFNRDEIDVFVSIETKKLIIQCKQYEKKHKPIKEWIREWSSKGQEHNANKVLLILWGFPKIDSEDIKLANRYKVNLWNDDKIKYFFNLLFNDKEKLKKEILLDLDIDVRELEIEKNKIIDELKNRYSDFDKFGDRFENDESEKSYDKLEKEFFSCYVNGKLFYNFKFKVLLDIIKNKGYYLSPNLADEDDNENYYFEPEENRDFLIERAKKDDELIEKAVFIVEGGYKTAISYDGHTLIKLKEFFNIDFNKNG